jgi:hypothetical protein
MLVAMSRPRIVANNEFFQYFNWRALVRFAACGEKG